MLPDSLVPLVDFIRIVLSSHSLTAPSGLGSPNIRLRTPGDTAAHCTGPVSRGEGLPQAQSSPYTPAVPNISLGGEGLAARV